MEKLESEIVSFLSGDDVLAQICTTFISNLSSEKADILVDGFDDEQIFQQIEFLYTNPILEAADEFDKLEIESDEEEEETEIQNDQEEVEDGYESEEDKGEESLQRILTIHHSSIIWLIDQGSDLKKHIFAFRQS